MSEFHYVRTLGVDGGVDAVEGPAVGLDLETILKDGLPPFKIALEIIAALCEICDIADQDGETHGDVIPRYVFLDETGALSIEGFGSKRTKSSAPERTPRGALTDMWGIGYCAFRLLSAVDMPPNMPDEAQAYDDAVIDAIVGINFEDLPEEIVGDIQWFFAKMMSFEKEDRPSAVDVWRTFIAFADTVPGPRLEDWSNAALGGGGDRRDQAKAAAKPEAPKAAAPDGDGDEDLGGPVMQKGPMAKGGLSFDGGGKKGQATAFWSRDDMKKALEAEDEDESAKRKVPRGSATAFWTTEQMKAMSEGNADAPRPKRKENAQRPATMMMKAPKREDEEPDLDRKPAAQRPNNPSMQKPPPPPPPVSQPGGYGQPAQQPGGYGQPAQQPGGYGQPQAPQGAPAEGGSNTGMIIGVVVVLIILCGGGGLLLTGGAGAAWFGFGSTASTDETVALDPPEVKDPPPKKRPVKVADPDPTAADPKTDPKADPKTDPKTDAQTDTTPKPSIKVGSSSTDTTKTTTTTTKPTTTTTTKPTTTTSTKTTTTTTKPTTTTSSVRPKSGTSTPTPTPAATNGPVTVKLKSSGRGKLSCADGQGPSFDGLLTLEFDGAILPVSCMVTMDGHRGVFTVEHGATFTCNVSGSDVICN